MLSSDSKGFLVADKAIGVHDLTHGIKGVKHDTATIIKLLKGQTKTSVLQRARISPPNSSSREFSNAGGSTSERDYRGRFVKSSAPPVTGTAKAVRQMTRQQAQQVAIEKRTEAAKKNREGDSEQKRDSKGRFGAGDRGDNNGKKGDKDSLYARLKSALSDKSSGGDLDKVDPAIEAAHEMKTLIGGPMKAIGAIGESIVGRGFNGDAKDKAVPWYRRILQQLKLVRGDASAFSKAETKAIKGIAGGSGGGSDGNSAGLMAMAGSLVGALAATIGPALMAMGATLASTVSTAIATILSKIPGFGALLAPAAVPAAVAVGGAGAATFATGVVGAHKEEFKQVSESPMLSAMSGDTGMAGAIMSASGEPVYQTPKGASFSEFVGQKKADVGDWWKRKKTQFNDIKGSIGLSKYGTYTGAEADKINQLKGSGANTSANVAGGMPKDIQEKIIAQSKAAGLDPAMMLKIAAMESGGNANAISSTGAIGVYQFTGKTATGVGIKDRFNADENIAGAMKLTKENIASLTASKLPVTAENLYMMHQLSPDAAKEIIRGAAIGKNISDLSPKTQGEVSKNYGAGSKTAADYLGKNSAALTSRADAVIGKAAMSSMATGTATIPVLAKTATLPTLFSASAGIPSLSVSAPSLPAPTPRSDIPVQLNSKGPLEVTVKNDRLANRDLLDRRLAAIATGGLSN